MIAKGRFPSSKLVGGVPFCPEASFIAEVVKYEAIFVNKGL